MDHAGEERLPVEEIRAYVRRMVEHSSIRGVAERLGMSFVLLQRFVNGEGVPNRRTLQRLADCCGAGPADPPPWPASNLVPLSPAQADGLFRDVASWGGQRPERAPVDDVSAAARRRMHLEWRNRWRRRRG